jgi:hypothetical protein
MSLRNFTQVGEFDIAPPLEDLAALPAWNWLNVRRMFAGSEHGQVDDIVLRFAPLHGPKSVRDVFDGLECVSYFPWFAMPGIRQLVEDFEPNESKGIGRVVVALLRPGGVIKSHRDEGAYALAHRRFHFSLTSAPECIFVCGDESVTMLPGQAWEFNHHEVHSVVNASEEPRIHVIADYLH